MQLLVELHRFRALRFQLLHLITNLNALKMLPRVKKQARRQAPPAAQSLHRSRRRAGAARRTRRVLSIRLTV